MHIEDLIILLASRVTTNPFDEKVVLSFYDQISRGSGFTEKQEQLAIKILKRQKPKLDAIIGKDIEQFLSFPSFRLTRRVIRDGKFMSIVPHALYSKAIKVEFPFNEEIVEKIRSSRSQLGFANWEKEDRAWIFSLDEKNLNFLSEISEKYNFSNDTELADYFLQVRSIKSQLENYIPVVSLEGDTVIFKNVSPRIQQPSTSDILESLFLARKMGIHTWDEKITEKLRSVDCNKTVMNFLDHSPSENFDFSLENDSIYSIKDIVKYLQPCIFVIPGGSELEKMQTTLEFLKSVGIDNSEISVLFRLPKETGENFNKFVKDNFLNNPVTEKTRIVCISAKIPKTIIETNIEFNSVINFNFYNVHYTIRELIKNHHNVVNIFEKISQRSLNFAFV